MDITGIGSVADLAKGLVDRFFPPAASPEQKAAAQLGMEEVLSKREASLVEAQKSIIVSEMSQGDNYTKRARPTIVYAGLFFIFLVHVFFPILIAIIQAIKGTTISLPTLSLPEQFWWAWGGVCSVWVIGRSAEKRGASNKLVSLITGAS